jgi:NIMA (never in mitosis gene a)-related kinase
MIREYQILEKIGKGTFGTVYKVKKYNESFLYVIKQIPLNELTEEQIKQVNTEAKLLSLINSNFVVKYFESFIDNYELFIVMEYCDNGDLYHFLQEQQIKSTPLKEDLVWQIFIKITLGLSTIHKMKILHRDLKTLNIFLNKDMGVKIGDLGIAKQLNQGSFANTLIGTPYYISPEMCEDKPYNQKSDVWALGCILYELCTFRHPFDATNQGALFLKIMKENPEPIFACYSSNLQKLVNQILEKNYEKRPSCLDILNNPIVIEKAKKFGLYHELEKACYGNNEINSQTLNNIYDNNDYNNFMNAQNGVTQTLNNYDLQNNYIDTENILLKTQLEEPNNNNKIFVKKLVEPIKDIRAQNIKQRNGLSRDKKIIQNNNNNYVNINQFGNDKNIMQYIDPININLINKTEYSNYPVVPQYKILNNNYNLVNQDYYYLNKNINYTNLNAVYNNDINQNNIYYNALLNNNNINANQYSSIPFPKKEPMKIAKVTKIYDQPNPRQIIPKIKKYNTSIEDRNIDEINDSLSVSVKIVPMDQDRNLIYPENVKDSDINNYPSYSDNLEKYSEEFPFDNIKYLNQNNAAPVNNIAGDKKEYKFEIQKNNDLSIKNEISNKFVIQKNSNNNINILSNENKFNNNNNNNNKLNKTSINISSSINDNFNINVNHQEPLPIGNQMKSEKINEDISDLSSSDFNLLKDSGNIKMSNEDLKINENENLNNNIKQENDIEINSLENKLIQVKNDIYLLIGETDYKKLMDFYETSKDEDKDNLLIGKYIEGKYPKEKIEKFLELYSLFKTIDSKIMNKK